MTCPSRCQTEAISTSLSSQLGRRTPASVPAMPCCSAGMRSGSICWAQRRKNNASVLEQSASSRVAQVRGQTESSAEAPRAPSCARTGTEVIVLTSILVEKRKPTWLVDGSRPVKLPVFIYHTWISYSEKSSKKKDNPLIHYASANLARDYLTTYENLELNLTVISKDKRSDFQ